MHIYDVKYDDDTVTTLYRDPVISFLRSLSYGREGNDVPKSTTIFNSVPIHNDNRAAPEQRQELPLQIDLQCKMDEILYNLHEAKPICLYLTTSP